MEALLILVIVAALLALGYAAFNFIGVKKLDEGTDRMKEIAAAIRVGANAFITYEYKIIAVVLLQSHLQLYSLSSMENSAGSHLYVS